MLTSMAGPEAAASWSFQLTLLIIFLLALAAYYLCVKGVMPIVVRLVKLSPTKWDDDLLNSKVRKSISQLMPALIVAWLLPSTLSHIDKWHLWITKLTSFYILWASINIVIQFLGAFSVGLNRREKFSEHNLSVIFQALKLISILVGIIIGISILAGKSPARVLTAFGASAAILMLVFKDTILGFVAGIQLSANKMLKVGDWIISDKAHANGEVMEVKINTVKVRNWDNSITTVPTYTLVSDSFQNYQNMRDHGLRRVARSIFIDMNTIRFLSEEDIKVLRTEGLLEGISAQKASKTVNLSLFRKYLERYLSDNREIEVRDSGNSAILLMVRQLQPTVNGLPIELYFFTTRTGWKDFETLQSEIFDHVYAVVGKFGLRIFQAPAGSDIKSGLQKIADGYEKNCTLREN